MIVYGSRFGHKAIPLSYYLGTDDVSVSDAVIDGMSLAQSAENGALPQLAAFLFAGVEPNQYVDDRGATLLHYAGRGGHAALVQFLLDNGASVNVRDSCGQTPLMWACERGNIKAAEVLLTNGADVSVTCNDGKSCYYYGVHSPMLMYTLIHNGKVPLTKETIEEQAMLHYCCSKSGTRFAALFLLEELGANPNYKDKNGMTALHVATTTGDIDLVKALVERGGDPEIADGNGVLPAEQKQCTYRQRSFINSYIKMKKDRSCNTVNIERLTSPDYSKWSRLSVTEMKQTLVALLLPNIILLIGTQLPTVLGILCVIIASAVFGAASNYAVNQKSRSMILVGWVVGTVAFSTIPLYFIVFPAYIEMNPESNLVTLFYISLTLLFINYFYAALVDPGCVQSTLAQRREAYEAMNNNALKRNYDYTAMVRKPNRSKHCSKTGQCVHRFDHYCVWIGNTVGGGNHRAFMWFCIFQFVSHVIVTYITVHYYLYLAPPAAPPAFKLHENMEKLCRIFDLMFGPVTTVVTYYLVFYNTFLFLFSSVILSMQLWLALRNVTSNEVWFANRYKWMLMLGSRAYSYYDRGPLRNLLFFFWTGDLCKLEYDLPLLSPYLQKKVKIYGAHIHPCGGPTPQISIQQHLTTEIPFSISNARDQAVNSLVTPAQLSAEKQRELSAVQVVFSQLIQGRDPLCPDVIEEDRRETVIKQAKDMVNIYRQKMADLHEYPQPVVSASKYH